MSEELTIDHALRLAGEKLAAISESPRLDAELMLIQAINVSRSYLFTYPQDTLDAAAADRYFAAVERRLEGEPLAYIQGEKEFWSLSLMVSPDTLVPRPETELLVQMALELIPAHRSGAVLDLGTGCGAIALAIASERAEAQVTATDISAAALGIARENARQLEITNVTFEQGDWTDPVLGRTFDIIVCNPPYIRTDDPALATLQAEPQLALVSGSDGLDTIRRLADLCVKVLNSGGTMLMEHAADQRDDVAEILEHTGWSDIHCRRDLAGLPRVTAAIRPSHIESNCRVGP